MWETIAIIAALGGLEFILWFLNRRAARLDREMQRKQLELLDGILTELAIQNSEDTIITTERQGEREVGHGDAGNRSKDRTQEHSVCN